MAHLGRYREAGRPTSAEQPDGLVHGGGRLEQLEYVASRQPLADGFAVDHEAEPDVGLAGPFGDGHERTDRGVVDVGQPGGIQDQEPGLFVDGIEHRKTRVYCPGWVGVFRWLKPFLSTRLGESLAHRNTAVQLTKMDAEVTALGRSTSAHTQALEKS